MRKKMEKLAKKVEETFTRTYNGSDNKYPILYFTETPICFSQGDDTYWGYKYFLCYHNTHTVYSAWRTQAEAIEELTELLEKYNNNAE